MNKMDSYLKALGARLRDMPSGARVAFGAWGAERLYPYYAAFHERTQWGSASAMRRLLDAVWNHACGKTIDSATVAAGDRQIAENTPDLDEFAEPNALDFCNALTFALAGCTSKSNWREAVSVGEVALDQVGAYVGVGVNEPAREDILWASREVQGEVASQQRAIDILENGGTILQRIVRLRDVCKAKEK